MHSIVTTFRGAVIKVEVANFCAAMDTLIDQDAFPIAISVQSYPQTTIQTILHSDSSTFFQLFASREHTFWRVEKFLVAG